MAEQSLADRAVETLAAVRAMDAGVEMVHPERHAVRELKRAELLEQIKRMESNLEGMRQHKRTAP